MKKYLITFYLVFHTMACCQAAQFGWGSTDIRYGQSDNPPAVVHVFKATAWKGERINAQAVLWTDRDLSEVKITVGDLKSGQSIIPSAAVRTHFVGYVMTDELNKDGQGACGHRPNKADWDSSLVADMLDNAALIAVKAHTLQPVWVNIWVPSDVKAGKYKGQITVSADNLPAASLTLEIDVLSRTLPAPQQWSFHLDLWQNPYAVARYHQVPLWSEAHFEAMRPVMKMLANAGQKVITTTILHKPWNGQTEDPFDSMIGKTKKIDGAWSYDYTVFDKWVAFMQGLGIDRQINCYSLIPWALHFDYFDQATNRIMYVDAKPGSDAYNEYWGHFIADFAKHLRQKGWFDKTTIAMDERPLDVMLNAIHLIRSIEPAFKISLAGNYHPEIENELYDYCIAFGQSFPEKIKAAREAQGKISTVYTCCAEARPNTFTFSPPAEAAWMGWHALAGNYDGYLRWAYNSWTQDPLNDSRFRTWAAGDCYLVYPAGRSSIRMERLIEGIQDYEKYKLLQEEYAQKGKSNQLHRLQKIISQFTLEELTRRGAAEMVAKARKELNKL